MTSTDPSTPSHSLQPSVGTTIQSAFAPIGITTAGGWVRRTPPLQIPPIYAYRGSLYSGANAVQVALISAQVEARSAQGEVAQLGADKIGGLQRVYDNYGEMLKPMNATGDTVRELDQGAKAYRDVQVSLDSLGTVFGQTSTFIQSDLNNLYSATYDFVKQRKEQGSIEAAGALDILDEAEAKTNARVQATKKGKQQSFAAGAQGSTDLSGEIQRLKAEIQTLRNALSDAHRANVDAGIQASIPVSTGTVAAGRRTTAR